MYIIGICGPSGSGKSTLAQELKKNLNGTIISLDNYFVLPPKYEKYKEQGKDLELPENTDWKKINEVIDSLKKTGLAQGQKVNWKKNINEVSLIKASNYLIIEGFLAFYDLELLKKLDLAIYLDISDKDGINRRILRENSDKNKIWFEKVTFPEYKKRRKIFEKRANIILDATLPLNEILQIVLQKIR